MSATNRAEQSCPAASDAHPTKNDSRPVLGGQPVKAPSDPFKTREPDAGAARPEWRRHETLHARGDWPLVVGYEILSELGRGGMGVVYKARQEQLNRIVALKMILTGVHASAAELTRFRSEAEAVAHLEHPNIVHIYEVGEQDGRPFFSLEFVPGGALSHMVKDMGERRTLELIEKLARATQFAHSRGIIHRDLKPANILLTTDGSPKIADFGLAKRLDHDVAGGTGTGAVVGTPSYMAPEQAMGQVRDIDPAADVYSLGAILYELLTGRPPFRGATHLDTLQQVRTQEPIAPRRLEPKIHRDVETICLKCLRKDPRQRYASAAALADDIRRFLGGVPIHARPTPAWERIWKWAKRRPALVMLITLFVVLSAGGVGSIGVVLFHSILQQQLDQALHAQFRGEIQALVLKGETALAAQQWKEADRFLTEARERIGDADGDLDDLKTHIDSHLEQIRPKVADQIGYRNARSQYERFRKLHADAVFYGTLFTGLDSKNALESTRRAAAQALQIYAVNLDNDTLPAVDARFLTAAEKSDVATKCYELLLVLAEAVFQAAGERRQHAEQALHSLERARRLDVPLDRSYHLRRARYLTALGQNDAAAEERARADQVEPAVSLGFFWLGDEMFKEGKLSQAATAFENALRLQPDHFWAQYLLAVCQLRLQQPAQARASLTACLSQRPDFLWIYSLRGFANGELGEYGAALADFQKALDGDPNPFIRYGILVNRSSVRLRQGKLEDAVADLQAAIAVMPNQFRAHVSLAEVYEKQQKPDEALAALNRVIALEPGIAALYRDRARVQLLRHDDKAALQDINHFLALQPNDSADPSLAREYVARGRILGRAHDYRGALESYDQAFKLNPQLTLIHRLRGEALLELKPPKDYPAAIQAFDDYLKTAKPDAGVFQSRASARAILGNYVGAIEDYTQSLTLKPDARTYAGRGWARVANNALRPALDDFDNAVRLDRGNAHAICGRAYTRVKLGQVRQGIADAEEALRLAPHEEVSLLRNLARTYAQAVAKLDEEDKQRHLDGPTLELRFQYQDQALRLIRRLMDNVPRSERLTFWTKYLQRDPDLESVRRTPSFTRLQAEFVR